MERRVERSAAHDVGRVIAIALLAATVALGAACGGKEDVAAQTARLECSQPDKDDIDWSAIADPALKRCSAQWEYGDACCDFGYQQSEACRHTHQLANATFFGVAQSGTKTCWRECIRYNPPCQTPGAPLDDLIACTCAAWSSECVVNYPDCSMTQASQWWAQQALAAVVAERNGCTTTLGETGAVYTPSAAEAPRINRIYAVSTGTLTRDCMVEVAYAPVGHAGEQNKCTNVAHLGVCRGLDGTRVFDRCAAIGTTNPDRSLQLQVPTTQCPALPKLLMPAGTSLAAFTAAVPPPQRGEGISRCRSGEDLDPLGLTPADVTVRKKYDDVVGLLKTLDPNGPDAPITANHVKLLFEFFGHQLRDDQRNAVAADVYERFPDAPSCGSAWDRPANATSTPALAAVTGDVQLCQRLLDRHVKAPDLPDQMSLFCADAVAQAVARTAAAANASAFTEKMADTAADVLQSAFDEPLPGGALDADRAVRLPILQRRMWTLGRWYDGAKGTARGAYADPNATEKLWANTSAVAGAIWRALHQKDLDALKLTQKTEADLDAFFRASAGTDDEMIRAVFTDYTPPVPGAARPPLVSGPAMLFVSDGFRILRERFESLAPYHDFGCRFRECAQRVKPQRDIPNAPEVSPVVLAPERKTELSTLYRFLGQLHDAAGLQAAIQDADAAAAYDLQTPDADLPQGYERFFSATRWKPWRDLFARVLERHADVVQPAVKEMMGKAPTDAYDPAWVTTIQDTAPKALVELSGTVALGSKRYDAYRTTGQFLPNNGNLLPVGLLADRLTDIKLWVQTAGGGLDTGLQDYRNNRGVLVTTLMQAYETGQSESELTARRQALLQQVLDLAADDAGMKVLASIDQARLSDVVTGMRDTLDAIQDAPGYVDTPVVQAVPITGSDSQWSGPARPVSPVDVAVPAVRDGGSLLAHGEPGEILYVTVEGSWSPTCALQERSASGGFFGTPLMGVDGLGAVSDMKFATTGPAGFGLTYTDGQFRTNASTTTTTDEFFFRAEMCAGANWGGPVGPNASLKVCAGYSHSTTFSDSDSNGRDRRTSAAFAQGLRLSNTPYPDFPVGSLVAFVVSPTDNRKILDAYVLQAPRTAITFSRPGDVYLVVNDKACGNAGPGGLSVSARRLTPAADKALALARAMQTVGVSLESRGDAIVAQGRLMPDDATYFRRLGWQEIRKECTCEPTDYPPSVVGFFETWLDGRILAIERQVQHLQNRREMDYVQKQIETVNADLEAVARKGRLQKLLPYWTLENLNFANQELRSKLDRYMATISDKLHPMVYLRYPEALVALPEAERLLKTDWYYVDLAALVARVVALGNRLADNLDLAVQEAKLPTSSRPAVVKRAILRFPNPFRPPLGGDIPPPGRSAKDARARAIWTAIGGHHPVEFGISEEDLYQAGTSNTLLTCELIAPSILQMALYVTTDYPGAEARNYQDIGVDTWAGRNMVFPTERGRETFLFGNEDWRSSFTKIMYGPASQAQYWLDTLPPDYFDLGPIGLSPFNTWSIASLFDAWAGVNNGDPYGDATELLVVLKLEARYTTPGVNGVGTCPLQ
ncbi:MAG TPA: hypothetical protein VFL83_20100 [Anaeromyxobacter sp.]|nr:hypothetical protein [Anaeromyxobacter sp.]